MVPPSLGAAMMGTMYFLRASSAQHGGGASGGGLISASLLCYWALAWFTSAVRPSDSAFTTQTLNHVEYLLTVRGIKNMSEVVIAKSPNTFGRF